jgi:DNA-binding NarL/FixJ family response regulator
MNAQPIRILLIEDNPFDAYLVEIFLEQGLNIPAALVHARDLAAGLGMAATQAFDVVLLDLNLPDSAGLETFSKVHAQVGDVPIVVLSADDQEDAALAAVRMGAQDYLVKGMTDSYLLGRSLQFAIERSARREQYTAERAEITRQLAQISRSFAKLSPREMEVLEQIALGKSVKQIALASGTSYHTVKNQRASIMTKLDAQCDADLVRMVMVVRFGKAVPPADI